MSILKRSIIVTISIVFTLTIAVMIVLWMFNGNLFFMAPSYNKMDMFLKANDEKLSHVANILLDMNYDSITIRNKRIDGENRFSMIVSSDPLSYKTIPLPEELFVHIEVLQKNGVQVVSCGSCSVNFSMWSTMDESRGIIYSKTGKSPNGEQLIEVKQLSKANWYYYVHNYEKAKARNPEKFK